MFLKKEGMKNKRVANTPFPTRLYGVSYPNQSKSIPYVLSILNENYNYFLLYLGFFGYIWAQVKDHKVTVQVSTTFSKAPYQCLVVGEIISIVAHFKLILFRLQCCFLHILTLFWTSGVGRKGPVKQGMSALLSVLPSALPSFRLSRRFLGILSLFFSKFWHDPRNPYKVVRARAGFSRKKFFASKIEKTDQNRVFEYIEEFCC